MYRLASLYQDEQCTEASIKLTSLIRRFTVQSLPLPSPMINPVGRQVPSSVTSSPEKHPSGDNSETVKRVLHGGGCHKKERAGARKLPMSGVGSSLQLFNGPLSTGKRKKLPIVSDDFLRETVSSNEFPFLDPVDIPFGVFEKTTEEMSRVLENLRCTTELRELYYNLKTSLNQFKGLKDADYFSSYTYEDFGDKATTDESVRSFKNPNFAWEKFTGANGQLEGLTTEQKRAVVFRVSISFARVSLAPLITSAAGTSGRFHDNTAVVAHSGRKRKAASCELTCQSGCGVGDATRLVEDESDGFSMKSVGLKLSYQKRKTHQETHLLSGAVPVGAYCSRVGPNVKPTNCLCRFMVFQENSFLTMLPAIDQLCQLRYKISKTVCMHEVGTYFSAVFGVTNIASRGGINGARGFQFYFHIDRDLGTFCQHAMSVLLGESNWSKVCNRIFDRSLKKVKVHEPAVLSLNAKKVEHNKWVINKDSVYASCFIDIIIGYARHMKDAMFKANRSGVLVHEYFPDRRECLEKCFEYGLNAAPVPAGFNTQRKAGYSGPPMAFIRMFDRSRQWPPPEGSSVCYMANPQHKYLFQTSTKYVSRTIDGIKGLHGVDVMAVQLVNEAVVGVDYLRSTFGIFFGPGGLGSCKSQGCPYKLTADPSVPFVYSFLAGDFDSSSSDKFIARQYYNAIVDQVKAKVMKSEAFLDKFPEGSGFTCTGTLSFKVNRRTAPPNIRLQLPHVLMAHDKLVSAQVNGCLLVRVIVPLDRAGCIIVVWPSGNDQNGVLVFIPPNVVLVLPVTVPTSDCPQFTPSGQARAEIIIALFHDKRSIPEGIKLENHEYYYPCCGRHPTTNFDKYIALDSRQVEKNYPTDALKVFIGLFDPMY